MNHIVFVHGGLGNQLFNIAFIDYLQLNGINAFPNEDIPSIMRFPHSKTDYYLNIFQHWSSSRQMIDNHTYIREERLEPQDWVSILKNINNASMFGCFQHYKYVLPDFIGKLNLPVDSISKYPNIQNSVFIHVRGGDYVNNWFHDVKLYLNYYKNAIAEFETDTEFLVFTNDIPYAKSILPNTLKYTIVEENELDSLYLMSQCKGGICSNSTFAWWGAYLNKNRKLILPSKWFNDNSYYTEGFYFPEATIVNI